VYKRNKKGGIKNDPNGLRRSIDHGEVYMAETKMHDLYQLTPHASLSGVQENEKKKSKK
jgi:hypothetical protein